MERHSSAPAGLRGALWANGLALALLLWIGIRYLLIGLEVRSASVVALTAIPPWPLYAGFVALAAALAGLVGLAVARRATPESKVFRLLPVASAICLSTHWFVLPTAVPPIALDQLAIQELADVPSLVTPDSYGLLPVDAEPIAAALRTLPCPYLRNGQPMTPWALSVVRDCTGPIVELPPGIQAGTLLYCVAADRRKAWMSGVGTASSLIGRGLLQYQGRPAMVALGETGKVEQRAAESGPVHPTASANPDAGP